MTSFLLPENALTVIRGTSKTIELEVTQPKEDDPTEDEPVNLTGARVVFTAKRFVTDSLPLILKDSGASSAQAELTEPRLGKARIYLDAADTQELDIANYIFDVWVVLVSGKRYAVVQPSVLEIQAGVTRIAL